MIADVGQRREDLQRALSTKRATDAPVESASRQICVVNLPSIGVDKTPDHPTNVTCAGYEIVEPVCQAPCEVVWNNGDMASPIAPAGVLACEVAMVVVPPAVEGAEGEIVLYEIDVIDCYRARYVMA